MNEGVYIITILPSGYFYIGCSFNIKKRMIQHFESLRNNRHRNVKFQNIFNTCEIEDFSITVIPFSNRREALEKEKSLISKYKNCPKLLNIELGYDTYTLNPNKEGMIKKRTESYLKTLYSYSAEERSAKYGKFGKKNGMYGRTHSDEVKARLSEINKGRPSPLKGTVVDKNSQKYRKYMEYIKNRNYYGSNNPFYGKKHSDEFKQKLSLRLKGVNTDKGKKVSINGKVYITARAACKDIGINYQTLTWRCRNTTNKDFSEWKYLSE